MSRHHLRSKPIDSRKSDARLLGMFAKYWQPGAVKSRLASRIGPEAASQIYEAFVRTLVARCAHTPYRKLLAFTPSDRAASFAALGGGWRLVPQASGDLGERMRAFLAAGLAENASRIVLIGSDSPDLPLERIAAAFEQLEHYQVVLGPSTDGGYYLLGIREQVPPIFEQVEWSTPQVFARTVELLEANNYRWTALDLWWDVDYWEDLVELAERLQGSAEYRDLHRVVADVIRRGPLE